MTFRSLICGAKQQVGRLGCLALVVWAGASCSMGKHKGGHSPAASEPGSAAQATAQNSAQHDSDSGKPSTPPAFAWELTDLPSCYSDRDGAKIFVWRSQKQMVCNKATGKWEVGGAS